MNGVLEKAAESDASRDRGRNCRCGRWGSVAFIHTIYPVHVRSYTTPAGRADRRARSAFP
jgi:hypothetical protein